MTSCLSKLKVTPSFCFAFKIPDNPTATNTYPTYRSEENVGEEGYSPEVLNGNILGRMVLKKSKNLG